MAQSLAFNQLSSSKLPIRYQRFKDAKLVSRMFLKMPRIRDCFPSRICIKCNASGRSNQELRLNDVEKFHSEPFWLGLSREAFGVLRSLLVFLVEQPSQLRYIEWPSFQSTLKTATLTLILVALLIVALSSIDSALCFLLALLLRRAA